jgi:hypothetical protein
VLVDALATPAVSSSPATFVIVVFSSKSVIANLGERTATAATSAAKANCNQAARDRRGALCTRPSFPQATRKEWLRSGDEVTARNLRFAGDLRPRDLPNE